MASNLVSFYVQAATTKSRFAKVIMTAEFFSFLIYNFGLLCYS
jgi:hypothetical protein